MSKRCNNFSELANAVHHNKYDYSKVEYVNNRTKVCIICPEHGEFWQIPYIHLQGCGCPKCSENTRVTKRTLKPDEFYQKCKDVHGNKYTYSDDYINTHTKIKIICPEHGEFWQTPHNHLKGRGCPECGKKKIAERLSLNVSEFIEQAELIHSKKYRYDNINYVNYKTKIMITCPEHGIFYQTPANHLKGCGCPKCGNHKISEKLSLDEFDFIEKSKELHNNKYNYSKVNYVNYNTKVCIICPEHGEFWQTPDAHLHGCGCPKCSHQQSKAEQEIVQFLKQYLTPEQIVERDRELLDGQEVDILLPDFHVGIEFNGLYWHNLKHKPDANYHKNKMLIANSKGYRLIQIFEDEWIEHREIVLNKLKHVINADVKQCTIGARKCTVGQINREIAKVFLGQYHIQGYTVSTIYLGAYYKDELVGVMTFKEEQPKMWNLTRFTTKTEYRLPGLANKMFKYFKVNFEFEEVKSFLDLRWNQSLNSNTVYDKLGFNLIKYINPDYRYIVGHQRIHKFNMRKNTLHKKYGFSLTMTEREMCDELGIERIYDCGLAKYVWKS